jgi:hypothetical protein
MVPISGARINDMNLVFSLPCTGPLLAVPVPIGGLMMSENR